MATNEEFIETIATQFTKLVYDNFLSTESLVQALSGTGYITALLQSMTLATGVQQGSEAGMRYDNIIFNPYYSDLVVKSRISTASENFAFFGYKETTNEPAFAMTESHAGFMFYRDTGSPANVYDVYISTGNGKFPAANQQRIKIQGWDTTNWLEFKVVGTDSGVEFWIRSLPITYPYFNDVRTINVARQWTMVGKLATVMPRNSVHYLQAYITNTSGADRGIEFSHIVYGERYAD